MWISLNTDRKSTMIWLLPRRAPLMTTSRRASNTLSYTSISSALHFTNRDMNACDALLVQMQELLHLYQKDLSGVANEIRTLQVDLWGKDEV